MKVIQKLRMDLARCGCPPIAGAVQSEANTRVLEVSLYDNGVAWEIPAGTVIDVAYQKPDGTKGIYSRLPDGSPATTFTGNVLSATLAPQVLTCAGPVRATFVFSKDGEKTLAAFPFTITVEANPAAGAEISEDYFNPKDLSDLRAEFAAELTAGLATKAPAGYGLGVYTYSDRVARTKAQLDTFKENGYWSYQGGDNENLVSNGAFTYCYGHTVNYTANFVKQFAFALDGGRIERTCNQGTWGEWEWVNPLMQLGVEYRTTERFDGKVVYAKALNFGAMPNSTIKTMYIADGITDLVRVEGEVSYSTSAEVAPFATVSFVSDVTITGGTTLKVTTIQDASNWNGFPIVYYCKG